jgi:hypothetical protein
MPDSIAICFVLANPREETRAAYWERRIRSWLQDVPFVRDKIVPRWSPRRRLGYGAGLRACVNSLRRHHANLPPIIVLRPEGEGPTLADVDEVRTFDPAPYAQISIANTFWGRETLYKLELFALRGFERVVYLDCDTLVLDDVSALWDPDQFADADLYAVHESREMGSGSMALGKVTTGVLVLNQPLFSPDVHRRMIEIADSRASYYGADQGVLHVLLEESPQLRVGALDPAYNVMVGWKKLGRWEQIEDRIRILHFVNCFKPWSPYHAHDPLFDAEFKRLWDDAFRDAIAPIASSCVRDASLPLDGGHARPPQRGARDERSVRHERVDRVDDAEPGEAVVVAGENSTGTHQRAIGLDVALRGLEGVVAVDEHEIDQPSCERVAQQPDRLAAPGTDRDHLPSAQLRIQVRGELRVEAVGSPGRDLALDLGLVAGGAAPVVDRVHDAGRVEGERLRGAALPASDFDDALAAARGLGEPFELFPRHPAGDGLGSRHVDLHASSSPVREDAP